MGSRFEAPAKIFAGAGLLAVFGKDLQTSAVYFLTQDTRRSMLPSKFDKQPTGFLHMVQLFFSLSLFLFFLLLFYNVENISLASDHA